MVIYIVIAIILVGGLVYLGNRRFNDIGYVINKGYVCVPAVMSDFENELLELINNHRRNINLGEITKTDSFVRDLAEEHCNYMITNGNISHDNFANRVLLVKTIGTDYVGEVVAYGYATASGMLNGYLNSPSHKDVIEKVGLTHIGLRIIENDKGRNFNTIIFYKK